MKDFQRVPEVFRNKNKRLSFFNWFEPISNLFASCITKKYLSNSMKWISLFTWLKKTCLTTYRRWNLSFDQLLCLIVKFLIEYPNYKCKYSTIYWVLKHFRNTCFRQLDSSTICTIYYFLSVLIKLALHLKQLMCSNRLVLSILSEITVSLWSLF